RPADRAQAGRGPRSASTPGSRRSPAVTSGDHARTLELVRLARCLRPLRARAALAALVRSLDRGAQPLERAGEEEGQVVEEPVREEVDRLDGADHGEGREEDTRSPRRDPLHSARGAHHREREQAVEPEEADEATRAELEHPVAVGDREILARLRVEDAVAVVRPPAEEQPLARALEELVLLIEAEPEAQRALLADRLGPL